MQLFERFVESLTTAPVKHYGGSLSVDGAKTIFAPGERYGDLNAPLKKQILEHLEDTHVFIVQQEAIFSGEPINTTLDLDVAPPFKTCWFQLPEIGYDRFKGIRDLHEGTSIYALWVHEIGRQEYLFCMIMEDKNDPTLHRYRFGHASQTQSHEIWHAISIWLQPFSKDREITTGTMKTGARVKFKHPKTGQKILHKIRKVVMVYPKKMSADMREEAKSSKVNFAHRFEVRAYWRRLFYLDGRVDEQGNKMIDESRVGKNRDGEYCIAGWTFVSEAVKGPESAPLIKKTRVVLGE